MMAMEGSTKFIHLMAPPPPAVGFCASAMEGGGVRGEGLFDDLYQYIQCIDCYCVKGLYCMFPVTLLIFIYSMMFIRRYEPF